MQEIRTREEFVDFASRIDWTDAFVRECYAVSTSFLFRSKSDSKVLQACGLGGFTVRVLVMLGVDKHVAAVEFLFEKVGHIVVAPGIEIEPACTIDTWEKTVFFTSCRNYYISGHRLSYELLDENSWGPDLKYGSHVPDENAIPATVIQGAWRLCSSCCEAWEACPGEQFSICPSCLQMTKLVEGKC